MNKPKFVSKQEREKLELERKAQLVEQKHSKAQTDRQSRTTFFSEATLLAAHDSKHRNSQHLRSHGSADSPDWRRSRHTSPPKDSQKPSKLSKEHPPTATKDLSDLNALTPREHELIRERYMGPSRDKPKKTRRMNERRFVFDWDQSEDTSHDANPLYTNRIEYKAYGRGHIGGVDPTEKESDKSHVDDRHWSDKSLSEMKERDWRIFKEDFDISTKGGNIPRPLRSWIESKIPAPILKVIDSVNYKKPTPIQRQAIPIGLQNRDMLGIAETGSGKTLTFLVPLLAFILRLPKITDETSNLGPYALVMVPTRELAQQIEIEAAKFASPLGFRCVSIVGGHSIEEQSFSLSRGCEIIIATPGRLKDCLDRHIVVLGQCMFVVMDEADRMIDMGFEVDVTYILDRLPISEEQVLERKGRVAAALAKEQADRDAQFSGMNVHLREAQDMAAEARARAIKFEMDPTDSMDAESKEDVREFHKLPERVLEALGGHHFRQTVMFSATMPAPVERLAQKYLLKPATITIGNAGKAVDTVEQCVEFINDDNRKRVRLLELLSRYDPPIIVFFNLKRSVDVTAKMLSRDGFRVVALHGGKSQDVRETAIQELRDGNADILLATNVAGRGLDVHNVSLVVNFDMAKNIEEYTHRIGRTGRAGKKGVAVTFLTNDDADTFYDLKNLLLKSPVSRCPPELANHSDAQQKPGSFVQKRKFEETLYAR